jgi:hypothetical protein
MTAQRELGTVRGHGCECFDRSLARSLPTVNGDGVTRRCG